MYNNWMGRLEFRRGYLPKELKRVSGSGLFLEVHSMKQLDGLRNDRRDTGKMEEDLEDEV